MLHSVTHIIAKRDYKIVPKPQIFTTDAIKAKGGNLKILLKEFKMNDFKIYME